MEPQAILWVAMAALAEGEVVVLALKLGVQVIRHQQALLKVITAALVFGQVLLASQAEEVVLLPLGEQLQHLMLVTVETERLQLLQDLPLLMLVEVVAEHMALVSPE